MTLTKSYQVRPGYIVVDTSSCKGGVTYHRDRTEEREWRENGVEREIHSTKQIDDKAVVKEGNQLVSAARYILRKHCAQTAVGWFCEDSALPALRTEVEEFEAAADAFNARARQTDSACRVTIGIVPIRLELDNHAAAEAIARTIRETLHQLKSVLRAGALDKLPPVLLRAKNLDQLAVGMQRDSIVFALDCVKAARKELREARKDGRDLEAAGRALDLAFVDAAIGVFTDITAANPSPALSLVS